MCCVVHFYRSRCYEALYQGSIHAVLIMSVLWKKTEFYKRERDREVIVSAAGDLRESAESITQQAGLAIMGALPSHQIFSPPYQSFSSLYCYPKWSTKWINSQGDVKKMFCLLRVISWEFAIQKLLIPSLQQNFQVNVINLQNKSQWKTLAFPGKSLGWVSGGKTQFFFCFLMSLRQLNGLQWH